MLRSEYLAEFLLVGGFFWLLQCAWLVFLSPEQLQLFLTSLNDLTGALTAPLYPTLNATLLAVATLLIILAGLLLHLLGSVFVLGELSALVARLRFHSTWLLPRIFDTHPTAREDFQFLLEGWPQGGGRTPLLSWVSIYPLLLFRAMREAEEQAKHYKGWTAPLHVTTLAFRATKIKGLRQASERLILFLHAMVLMRGPMSDVGHISSDLRLWRLTRGLSAALVFGYLGQIWFVYVRRYADQNIALRTTLIATVFSVLLFLLGSWMSARSFARMIDATLAILMVTTSDASKVVGANTHRS